MIEKKQQKPSNYMEKSKAMTNFLSFQNPEDIKILSEVKAIYTDVDGTLLAPGGSFLRNTSGEVSYELAQKICELQKAGIKIILVSGRNQKVLNELARLFSLDGYISELGTVIAHKTETGYSNEYFLGEFEFKEDEYASPFEQVLKSGLPDKLIQNFSGRLEHSMPYALERSVTQSLWGNIDEDEASDMVKASKLPFELVNNGIIHPKEHGLSLGKDEPIYIYHLVPKGVSKASALLKDMQTRGYSAQEVVSLGDSPADVHMAKVSGSYVVMKNALKQERVSYVLQGVKTPTFKTSLEYVDGWCEFADALLKATTSSL